MHRHGGVAEHGFRPGGRDDQVILAVDGCGAVGQRVTAVPEMAVFLPVFDLEVGYGRGQFRVPVHQPFAPVDQPLFVQAHEDLHHRVGESRVQGEPLPGPVDGRTHAPQLPGDIAARALLPFPDTFDERIAPDIGTRLALAGQLAFHQHLRGDARVVRAHLPERAPAVHAVVADEGIHQRVLKGVPHVQAAGYVRGRYGDAVLGAVAGRREIARGLPRFVNFALNGMGVETALHVSALPSRPVRGGTADSPGPGKSGIGRGRCRASRPPRFPRFGRNGREMPAPRPPG